MLQYLRVIKMDMYNRIENLIKEKGLSKKELAAMSEVPYSSLISAFNRRSNSFSNDYVKKIAASLGCTIDYLVGTVPYPTWHVEKREYTTEDVSVGEAVFIDEIDLDSIGKIKYHYEIFGFCNDDYGNPVSLGIYTGKPSEKQKEEMNAFRFNIGKHDISNAAKDELLKKFFDALFKD